MKRVEIIKFLEDLFILEDGKPIKLEAWQKEKILKPVFYDLDSAGRRKINQCLVGMCKKNGKSTLAAGVAAYGLLGDGEPEPEIYGCAGDKDQAKIIFNQTAKAFRRSESLYKEVNIYKDVIERKDGRGFYRVLSADAPSAHGLNPHFVLWDELWNQRNYDLWEALTHSPARKQPLHFITTYAGYDQYDGNLLYDLYQRGLKKKDRAMHCWWSHQNLASWVSKEYLRQQKDRLPDHIYKRLHENRWTGGIGAFLSRGDVDACIDPDLKQKHKGTDGSNRYWAAIDLGLTKDRTVVAVCHKDRRTQNVILDNIRTWQGSKKEKVDISEVEDWVLHLQKCFRPQLKVLVDPWQAQNTIQRLKRKGIRIEEFTFTATNVTKLSSDLFSLFKNRRISIFDYQLLIQELMTAKIVEKSYGFRIDHESGGYTDHIMALGMAAMHADMDAIRHRGSGIRVVGGPETNPSTGGTWQPLNNLSDVFRR